MLRKYEHIDRAAGISLQLQADGGWSAAICTIHIEKEQLTFGKKITGLTSLEELSRQIPEKALLAINLTGKGILSKQIALAGEINAANFSSVLPNAKFDDFYIQHFPSGDQSFITLIRKTEADQWINRLQTLGFRPLVLSLDAFPVELVLPQLNIYTPDVQFNGHEISRDERLMWTAYRKQAPLSDAPRVLKIQQETIAEQVLLPYAAAFGLLMADRVNVIAADVPQLTAALQAELENRCFKVRGALLLLILFLLLLINFGLFSWLYSANNELTARVGRLSQSTVDRTSLEDQISQKEMLLQHFGWNKALPKSILIDQIAVLVPSGVSWTAVAADPFDPAKSRSLKTTAFADRCLQLSGTAEQVTRVNEWMARLKTKSWVKNVQLVNYRFNQEINTGQFTIIINY